MNVTPAKRPIRLLVVDDSAYNRRNIAEVFAGQPDVEVVGKAADGEEALQLVTLLKPDVITLDLEMPRMDGFTFLRILMSRAPTPVIVVSSYAQRENVFKALELGALDFVPKPDRLSPESTEVRAEILQKVLLVRSLRPSFVPTALIRRQVSGAFTPEGKPTRVRCPAVTDAVPRALAGGRDCQLDGRPERSAAHLRQAASRRPPPPSSWRSTCPTSSRAPSPSASTSAVP